MPGHFLELIINFKVRSIKNLRNEAKTRTKFVTRLYYCATWFYSVFLRAWFVHSKDMAQALKSMHVMLCFHHVGLLFRPFRNDSSHIAFHWKQKRFRIDAEHFLFPFGAMYHY